MHAVVCYEMRQSASGAGCAPHRKVRIIVKFQQVFYVLDSTFRLLWVGGDWDDFALQNSDGKARSSRVLGTYLTDHVAGTQTQEVLVDILSDVLDLRRSFRMDYRCDAPHQRRDVRLTVNPLRENRLLLTHDLLDARSFDSIGKWSFAPGAVTCKCSFCCAITDGSGWKDPFDPLAPHPAQVDYTVCPDCRATIDRERTRMRKAGRAA